MYNKLKNIHGQFGFNFPLLIAFLLPFGINYAIIIGLWSISFLCFENLKQALTQLSKNKWAYIILGFFFLHVVSYFFSANKTEALTSIEIKLSFLAFPVLFFASKYQEIIVKKIAISFVSGCFIASMICLFKAFYSYWFNDINAFFYSDFSYFMHPSYFAMYLIMALFIIILYYNKWLSHLKNNKSKWIFLSVVLIICIYLCASKMGLITAVLLLPTTVIMILYNKGYKKLIIGVLLSLIIGITLFYKLFPTPFERFKVAFSVTASNQAIDKTASESTAVRIMIWQESIKLIKSHLLYGTTPGDANDHLYQAYLENGLTGAYSKKLNAHNQFLQTFIGTGMLGFLLLLMMTICLAIYGFVKKNPILMLFSLLITLNFLVESMLQTQAGVIFYAFFLTFLLRYDLSKFTSSNIQTASHS